MNRVLFDIADPWATKITPIVTREISAQMFTQAGVPQAELAAGFTTVAETVGGAFLILGLLTRLAALCLLVVSIGAIAYVHSWNGIFVANGGWELVGALAAACLLFVALGAGRISIDGIFRSLFGKKAERKAAEKEAANTTAANTTAAVTTTTASTTTTAPAPAAAVPDLPKQREQAPATETQAAQGQQQQWSEEDLKEIDSLFADDQKKPSSG